MSMRFIGRLVTGFGTLMLLVSLAANPLGIGSNTLEVGWLQMLGSFLGCLVIVAGLWILERRK